MDTAPLHEFYRRYRERRLADVVALLSDDFLFKTHIPTAPLDPLRPRTRAEFTLLCHKFLEDYDILVFEPGPFKCDGDFTSAQARGVFRHKQTGKLLDTIFHHTWRLVDGKLAELRQDYDVAYVTSFLKSLDGGETA